MPLMTNSQAKKRCQWRAIASHCGPGIVAQLGKPRAVGWPSTFDIPSTPVVSKSVPTKAELRNIGRSIVDHLKLKHPTGDAATRYNVLQSLTYLIVIFGLLPLVVICGLALSPRLNTVVTGWVDLLGGRQSARSLHFVAALGLVIFVVVHVVEVFIAGVWNEMRSMITGWYRVPEDPKEKLPS